MMQATRPAHGKAQSAQTVLPRQIGERHTGEGQAGEGQAGEGGALHGVAALCAMGKAAFACAARHCGGAVVMARADNIEFVRPVPAGCAVDIRARVVFQGRSSMTVLVEIVPVSEAGRQDIPAIRGRFMMVAVDAGGRPIPIPVPDQHTAEESRP